ncbi:MAG: WD40 repeat domain-containing serine/threonine protein kinase [Planctomycetota bacterium]|nr:WD40 repeat domain-containing serine/threonine protein kinase [Planctomycetota bacterium]
MSQLLRDALQQELPKGAILKDLLNILPDISVDLQATIDVDATLHRILSDLSQRKLVNHELVTELHQQHQLDGRSAGYETGEWSLPNSSVSSRPEPRYEPSPPIQVQPSSDNEPPSLKQIINNADDGNIWIAQDPVLNRQIALKEFSPSDEREILKREQFLREAQITGQLEHPNIIPVYGVSWNENNQPYYTMKYVEGDTLADIISRHHQTTKHPTLSGLRPLLDIFCNVCRAIHYAHSRGVLHRDIKPTNIAIGNYGEVMVIDWGLGMTSAAAPTSTPSRTQPSSYDITDYENTYRGSCEGTPNYMSPEQIQRSALTPATDIYSLGGLLFSILTGKPPRHQRSTNVPIEQFLASVTSGDIPSPHDFNPSLPRALASIVNRAMALRPNDRYPTADTLLIDIQNALRDDPVTAHVDNFRERMARWIRKHQWLVTIAVGVAILGLISLTLQTMVLDTANDQAQTALRNSRLLTTKSLRQRDMLQKRNQDAVAAQRAATSSEQEADRQRKIGNEETLAAARLRERAAGQTQRAIQLADAAKRSASTAATAAQRAEDSLADAIELEQQAEDLAKEINADYLVQLSSTAEHLMLSGQPQHALSPLLKAITTTNTTRDRNALLSDQIRIDSILAQSPRLLHIRELDAFQVNSPSPDQHSNHVDLLFPFRNNQNNESRVLCLTPAVDATQPVPSVHRLPDAPTMLLPSSNGHHFYGLVKSGGSFTFMKFSRDETDATTSFHVGTIVTAAIAVPATDMLLLGSDQGESFLFDSSTGEMTTILPPSGTPIHAIAMSPKGAVYAFAKGLSVHVVHLTDGKYEPIAELKLPGRARGLHFRDDQSLLVVDQSGYVNEYTSFTSPERRIRFRPPNPGSTLDRFAIHSNGSILLYHSTNHLTYLTPQLTERTIESPHTLSLRSLKFDPSGNYAVTTTDRKTTTVWNLKTLSPNHVPLQSDSVVMDMQLNSASDQLTTLHADGTLRYWTLPLGGIGEPIYSGAETVRKCIPISPKGQTLIQTADSVILIDRHRNEIGKHTFQSMIQTLTRTSNPNQFLAHTKDGLFLVILKNDQLSTTHLATSAKSTHAYYHSSTGSLILSDSQIRIIRDNTQHTVALPTPNSHVTGLHPLNDQRSILITFRENEDNPHSSTTLLDLQSNTLSNPLVWNSLFSHVVAIPGTNDFLISGTDTSSNHELFYRFAGDGRHLPVSFMTVSKPPVHLEISGNGQTTAFSHGHATISLFDLLSPEPDPVVVSAKTPVTGIGLTFNGDRLFVASDLDITIFDVPSRRALSPPVRLSNPLQQFVATDDNRMLYHFGGSVMQFSFPQKQQLNQASLIRRYKLLLSAPSPKDPYAITPVRAIELLKNNP